MTVRSSRHRGKTLFLVILFLAFSTFTADVLDLREELHLLSCPYASLDNNVSTGITSAVVFMLEPVAPCWSVPLNSSVEISFLHLLPCGFRAPPLFS
jgi:hypothetical protein